MAHFLDKAKGQLSAVRGTVTDTLHSVRNEADANAEKLQGQLQDLLNKAPQLIDSTTRGIKETEEKAEKFKGEIKHLFHKGPQFYDKAKDEIKVQLFHKNDQKEIIGEDNGETSSPVKTSIPVQLHNNKMEEENNVAVVETSTPVQVEVSDAHSTRKEEENGVAAFFARIFEKCCEPFNKKKD